MIFQAFTFIAFLNYLVKSNFLNLKNGSIRKIQEYRFYKNFCWRDQDFGILVNPEIDYKLAFM